MSWHVTLSSADWWALFAHFLSLSLLSVGGAISTAPDMHRYLVSEQHWLTHSQFSSSIALAQAAPGPNILFVALLGWNIGINAGGGVGMSAWGYGLLGVGTAMAGIMLPSTTLTFAAARWGHRNRDLRAVRAFKTGMAPVVVGLLIATGWILTANHGTDLHHWPLWLLSGASALLVWRTRLHLLWLLGMGAVLGWYGWV